jgi:hypothetical protein
LFSHVDADSIADEVSSAMEEKNRYALSLLKRVKCKLHGIETKEQIHHHFKVFSLSFCPSGLSLIFPLFFLASSFWRSFLHDY